MDYSIRIKYPFVGFELLRNIKFLGDKVYEQRDSELDKDNGDIENNDDVYKLCGKVYKSGGHELYWVKGMLFEECEDSNNEICRENVEWADGKYFKQWKLDWEKKLERDICKLERDICKLERKNKELKIELDKVISISKELQDKLNFTNRKVCEDILTHIKSLKGNFSEYIEHASDHVIDQIQNCCYEFMDGRYPCKRRGSEILAIMVRKYMKKIIDPDVSRDEKRKILSHQQKGGGIFSLLVGTVLPALISAFVK